MGRWAERTGWRVHGGDFVPQTLPLLVCGAWLWCFGASIRAEGTFGAEAAPPTCSHSLVSAALSVRA
jgi:hypothetical protein